MGVLESALGELDERAVQRQVQPVILLTYPPPLRLRAAVGVGGDGEDPRQVQPLALPMRDSLGGVEHLGVTHGLVDAAEPEFGQMLADVFGDEPEVVLDELRLAVEPRPQLGVLRRHPHRAGVEVTDPHHDAAGNDQRCGSETVLFGAQQHRHHDVARGAHPAVTLHGDPVAQAVEQQRLLGVGQSDLPRRAGVFEAGQRRRAGAAVVPRDQHDIGVCLRHAGSDCPDTHRADQLDVDTGVGVGVLQIVDQLGEILDRVDVMVRGRRDQAHPGGGMPGLGDVRIDLVARELTPFTGFGALRHLDLDVGGIDQVVAGHPEPTGCDLFDGAAPLGIVETVDVLTALTTVGATAEVVHGDRHGFVGFGRDRSVTHRTGVEAGDDRIG